MNRKVTIAATTATLLTGAALTVAIGGGAAEATASARDSIASWHLKDGGVRGVDLAHGSITGAKVVDDSLTGADIDEDSLGPVQLAEAAKVADSALEAGTADAARRLLGMSRASVSASGELLSEQGGDIIAAEQADTAGRYIVTLASPDLGCTIIPTVTHNDTARIVGSASAWRKGPLQETFGRQVVVETQAPGGDATPDPLPFSLLIVC